MSKNLLEVVKENQEWSKFREALEITGYDKLLEQANNFTVFIPDNSAWASVDMGNLIELKLIVLSHIVHEKRLSSDKSLYTFMQAISTKPVKYNADDETFNGASIVSVDHVASNGVIHTLDKVMEVKKSIWEYLRSINYKQVDFINSLSDSVVDMSRSVEIGVDENGVSVYDVTWKYVNNFLTEVPLDDESKIMTYVVMRDGGYDALYNKYAPYFQNVSEDQTPYDIGFNVCGDMAFEGLVDITAHDTLANMFGVKVPLKNVTIDAAYEASNGRVYVIDRTSIRLREKVKPIIIEGENYSRTSDNLFVFTRYRRWASGLYDVHLCSKVEQKDTIVTPIVDEFNNPIRNVTGGDSVTVAVLSKTFNTPGSDDAVRSNINNFFIEYYANVNSVPYEIYYVAYDDVEGHYTPVNQSMRLEQKLFISRPGATRLAKDGDKILNNYLGDTICFVGQDVAGVHKLTQLSMWTLDEKNQLLKKALIGASAKTMQVPYTGWLNMWLCNTTRSTATRAQGMLYLDYIKLVPILPND